MNITNEEAESAAKQLDLAHDTMFPNSNECSMSDLKFGAQVIRAFIVERHARAQVVLLHSMTTKAHAALAELVRLKRIKDTLESNAAACLQKTSPEPVYRRYKLLEAEYVEKKPAAWEQAFKLCPENNGMAYGQKLAAGQTSPSVASEESVKTALESAPLHSWCEVECQCEASTSCPQGRIGSEIKCRIKVRNMLDEDKAVPLHLLSSIRHMVTRFLGWRLPEHFNPDAGISFKAEYNQHTAYPEKHEPIGTNLFTARQAEEMVRYMLEGVQDQSMWIPVAERLPIKEDAEAGPGPWHYLVLWKLDDGSIETHPYTFPIRGTDHTARFWMPIPR